MPSPRQWHFRRRHVNHTRDCTHASSGTPYVLLTNRGTPADRTCRNAILKNNKTERTTADLQQSDYKRIYIAADLKKADLTLYGEDE